VPSVTSAPSHVLEVLWTRPDAEQQGNDEAQREEASANTSDTSRLASADPVRTVDLNVRDARSGRLFAGADRGIDFIATAHPVHAEALHAEGTALRADPVWLDRPDTPYFCFKDIDENKPSGSIKVRIETIDYFLQRYRETLVENKGKRGEIDKRVAAIEARLWQEHLQEHLAARETS
jgi:hypothetical protein